MAVQDGVASPFTAPATLPTQNGATPAAKASGEREPLLPTKPATKDAPPARGQRFGLANFIADTQDVTSGTLPISVLIATAVGVVCGVVAWLYYTVLEYLLDLIWSVLPEALLVQTAFPPALYWTWIPFIGLLGACGVGLSIRLLGDPGDLASTVANVHKEGFVQMSHVVPMVFASQFSILGGGSLGPEAPLVAICACIAGWLSRTVFGQKYKNVIRKHTLMGMACALAAFFGVPLGGSLFALEINSRLGYEYFEHALEAILSGTVCLMVFRGLAGLEIGPIYKISPIALGPSSSSLVLTGAFIGLLGAALAFLFARGHKWLLGQFRAAGLLEDPLKRALVGGLGVVVIGVFIPQTLFWGEFEFQTIASGTRAESLVHVFPTAGLIGWEITGFTAALVTGVAKLVAISFTVAGGYRGGFIFPFFMAGASFGKAFVVLFPSVSPIIACLCFATGINVSITRTTLASTLILTALSGEVNAGPPLLAASLVAVFATSYMPFIGSQQAREDLDESQFFSYADVNANEVPEDGENEHV